MTRILGSRSKSLLRNEFHHIRWDGYSYHPKNLFGSTLVRSDFTWSSWIIFIINIFLFFGFIFCFIISFWVWFWFWAWNSDSSSSIDFFIVWIQNKSMSNKLIKNLFLNLKLQIFLLFLLWFDKICSNSLRDFESLVARTDLVSSSNQIRIPWKIFWVH